MSYLRAFIFVLGALVCMPIVLAKNCSREEAIEAETEAFTLPDWDSVYMAFGRFAHCDDGAISEGYSEAVGRLLAKDWNHFGKLYALVHGNKKFEQFVIRHIDETVPDDYLNQIIENVRQRCPKKSRQLCHLIEAAATSESNQ